MKQRDKINLQYKALETILKCISAIVLCSFIGWFIVDDANNKVMYATHEAKKIALQASWDKAVENGKAAVEAQRAEEERLAAEEAARKAAEEAEAKRLQEAKERAAQADGVAKENVVYGSKLGHVSVDGTNVSCSLYWGDSNTQFRYGAGCHAEDGCVLPGDNGTVFIGGHTGTVFSDLGSCQIGSLIHLTTSWGSFDYQMRRTLISADSEPRNQVVSYILAIHLAFLFTRHRGMQFTRTWYPALCTMQQTVSHRNRG